MNIRHNMKLSHGELRRHISPTISYKPIKKVDQMEESLKQFYSNWLYWLNILKSDNINKNNIYSIAN